MKNRRQIDAHLVQPNMRVDHARQRPPVPQRRCDRHKPCPHVSDALVLVTHRRKFSTLILCWHNCSSLMATQRRRPKASCKGQLPSAKGCGTQRAPRSLWAHTHKSEKDGVSSQSNKTFQDVRQATSHCRNSCRLLHTNFRNCRHFNQPIQEILADFVQCDVLAVRQLKQ